MKKIIIALAIVAASMTALSCDRYDDGRPPKVVREHFADMFPSAKDVEWEVEMGYWKVSFETGTGASRVDSEAWYNEMGEWVRTETDRFPSSLPEEIKAIISSSEYASAMIDDVKYVQTPSEEYYQFELTVAGASIYINVYSDGRIIPAKFEW